MRLVETPDNPLPPGGEVLAVTARDGVVLRAARWAPMPGLAEKGTVLLFHGRSEFIEKYAEVIGDLRGRGFHVATVDWRGQGGSQRLLRDPMKGHVRDFREYGLDLEVFFNEVVAEACPRPWFGLAHSMGGAILLDAVHEKRVPLERLVLSTPMLAIARIHSPGPTRLLASTLIAMGMARRYIPGGGPRSIMSQPFAGNPLTSDAVRHARFAGLAEAFPELTIGDPTVGWIRAALRHMAKLQAPRYALELPIPVLPIAAGADTVVSTPAIERFAARLKSGPAIVIPHARHELLMERDIFREQFWAAFDAFIPGSGENVTAAPTATRLAG